MPLPKSKRRVIAVILATLTACAVGGAFFFSHTYFQSQDDLIARKMARLSHPSKKWRSLEDEFSAINRLVKESGDSIWGERELREVSARLQEPDLTEDERMIAQYNHSLVLLRLGRNQEAIDVCEEVLARMRRNPALRRELPMVLRHHATSQLRLAEVENCIRQHNKDCCIFPLQGGGIHTVKGPAENALASFRESLEIRPGNLGDRWLLNILAMALGRHPDGVPPDLLIDAKHFESDYDIGRFTDVAPQLGLDAFNLSGGVIIEDFDLDGHLDIITSTVDFEGSCIFYQNNGDGSFSDQSEASGLARQKGGLQTVPADYDNDGDMDLLILRGAWMRNVGQIRNSLIRNNGDGTFTDATRESGLASPARPTQTAAWADFDNDGDLDLYIGNESSLESDPQASDNFPSQYFVNDGSGQFTDMTQAAGLGNDRYAKAVCAGDYDNDGDMDIYVSNLGVNRLYRNDGHGSFTDVAVEAGVEAPLDSFASWFFDYDNDGWLDLFVAAYRAEIEDVAADCLGDNFTAELPRLYRNKGDGAFESIGRESGLNHAWMVMGASFGDLDNDGFLDIYLGTGNPPFRTLMPNIMLRNNAGKGYQNVTTSGGFGHLQKGHGIAFADLDNDGDQDLYVQMGGAYPADKFANALFENPGHGNHFLKIRLTATTGNRQAVGARVKVVIDTPDGNREIHRAHGCVSSFGSHPQRLEIGLGQASAIKRIEVKWPVSKSLQIIEGVSLNSFISITEGVDGWTPLEVPPTPFKTTTPAETARTNTPNKSG